VIDSGRSGQIEPRQAWRDGTAWLVAALVVYVSAYTISYLRRLPVDTLKIAKPFVDVLTHGAKDEALAQAVVSLAQSLQLDVVAEGVELEAQLQVLREMGCRLGQGYLISRPVPASKLPMVVSEGRLSSAA
jgi:EAL domain-containing protein (putative c-di-GMP-specific phosphodiesterase class I)